jgi:hypothetical protein
MNFKQGGIWIGTKMFPRRELGSGQRGPIKEIKRSCDYPIMLRLRPRNLTSSYTKKGQNTHRSLALELTFF